MEFLPVSIYDCAAPQLPQWDASKIATSSDIAPIDEALPQIRAVHRVAHYDLDEALPVFAPATAPKRYQHNPYQPLTIVTPQVAAAIFPRTARSVRLSIYDCEAFLAPAWSACKEAAALSAPAAAPATHHRVVAHYPLEEALPELPSASVYTHNPYDLPCEVTPFAQEVAPLSRRYPVPPPPAFDEECALTPAQRLSIAYAWYERAARWAEDLGRPAPPAPEDGDATAWYAEVSGGFKKADPKRLNFNRAGAKRRTRRAAAAA